MRRKDSVPPSIRAARDYIKNIPDEVLSQMAFSMPWQSSDPEATYTSDPDTGSGITQEADVWDLQQECRTKYATNPQVNTAIGDMVGRMTGNGFEVSSEIEEIQDLVDFIAEDPRNMLPIMMSKYVTRAKIEGELFLVLTVHNDGFIEIDFREPKTLKGVGNRGCGKVFHPNKPHIPLFYQFQSDPPTDKVPQSTQIEQIPSIYVARYPDLAPLMRKSSGYRAEFMKDSVVSGSKFAKVGGFRRFVIEWDMGCLTERNVSQVRTTLEWINHYEVLKKYEIDHKKSAGAYLWTVSFSDPRAFRQWLMLSDAERKKTGIMAKKMPGGTIVLPPGMEMKVQNPNLPNITNSDTDILSMVISGLNQPEDMVMGTNAGTYAAVKASRGPMTDRVSNELAYFERFLRYIFWDSIFYLSSQVSDFAYIHKVKEAVSFKKQKPVYKVKKRSACKLIDVAFPISEVTDIEARARGLLGVKHGSLNATMGIPNKVLAKKMGFGSYGRLRLQAAQEEEEYPELQPEVDAEGTSQEGAQEKQKGSGEAKKTMKRKDGKNV